MILKMGGMRQISAIIKKDILAELRTKEMVVSMLLFVLLVIVAFHYAFGESGNFSKFAGGLLWIAFLFTSLLGLNRSFVHEKDEGCLEGLLLAPVDRPNIFFGKMLGNLLFISVVEFIGVPLYLLLFNFAVNGPLYKFVGALMLSNLGIATIGTLLSTISINTKMRDMLLPLIFLPLVMPVLIAAVMATNGIMAGPANDLYELVPGAMKLLAGYDIIFLLVAYALYDFVIGE
ncbi:MAG: heme exporter protein CcmB [Rubrobacteridae bacterium]|nr:heme exporter protein CcmB [Rubrobacteridae bacterium]